MFKYEGKTLEEALAKIAVEKNCEIEDITYNILEEKNGMFGLGNKVVIEAYVISDVSKFIVEYLKKFFADLEINIEVGIALEDNTFKVNLNADNNAILIGKNGTTLRAINNVVRAATNATFRRRFYLLVDINNYKIERYEKLKAIAKREASKVKKTKIDVLLDPMPNDERKVVHQVLQEFDNIKTLSEGEGFRRRLRISYTDSKEENS
ncbi:MAG: protein jag [Erysipelotrichaceae bacterium]